MQDTVDCETLRSLIRYDQETGLFTWLKRPETDRFSRAWNARYAGKLANSVNGHGYIQISIKTGEKKKRYEAHRLAWLYVYGEFPEFQLDHVNRVKTDNRISNLRRSDVVGNAHNVDVCRRNSSGVKGVSWHKGAQKWMATITFNNQYFYLGLFFDLDDAKNAYNAASISLAGEFSAATIGKSI